MSIKIGIGFDFHIFKKGAPLILGGVEIPYEYGLVSETDGDILIHALVDALLGATGTGDIGELFCSSWKNKSSVDILKTTINILKKKEVRIINIDAIVIMEKPKILDFKEKIKENLSKIMEIDKNLISIKGKTMEGMGVIGEKKGASALVVVLVEIPPFSTQNLQ